MIAFIRAIAMPPSILIFPLEIKYGNHGSSKLASKSLLLSKTHMFKKEKSHEPHFHFNENIISFQGGISKVYIRHFAWANGRVAVAGVQGGRRGGWSGATPRAPPTPFAGSIRHLSWSPWRPRTERGGAAASGWWVHGTPRSPRAAPNEKIDTTLFGTNPSIKICHVEIPLNYISYLYYLEIISTLQVNWFLSLRLSKILLHSVNHFVRRLLK